MRRAAEALGRADPLPAVVREVVERTVEVERSVPVAVAPRGVAGWVALLEHLAQQMREEPLSLVRGPDDVHALAAAVEALSHAVSGRSPDPPTGGPVTGPGPRWEPVPPDEGLSRQQRRARERARRKGR